MKFKELGKAISNMVSKSTFKIKASSPEILISLGIAAMAGGAILACTETIKATKVLDEAKEKMKLVEDAAEQSSNNTNVIYTEEGQLLYTKQDKINDTVIIYTQAIVKLFKIYWPSLIIFSLGIFSVLSGNKVLRKRYLAMLAAYDILDSNFKDYRNKVIDEFGKDIDNKFRFGIKEENIKVKDKNGTEKTIEKAKVLNKEQYSIYARFFDEGSKYWDSNPMYNLMFLRNAQNTANDLFRKNGHLFLNEVYDLLDIPRTQPGAVVGWLKNKGEDFVDFGIYDGVYSAN